tara:strand:+ start:572 stop:1042 length:471 start_codon:yes stop_codon:yes gene_type:complete
MASIKTTFSIIGTGASSTNPISITPQAATITVTDPEETGTLDVSATGVSGDEQIIINPTASDSTAMGATAAGSWVYLRNGATTGSSLLKVQAYLKAAEQAGGAAAMWVTICSLKPGEFMWYSPVNVTDGGTDIKRGCKVVNSTATATTCEFARFNR